MLPIPNRLYRLSLLCIGMIAAVNCGPGEDTPPSELGELEQGLGLATITQYSNLVTNTVLSYVNGKKAVATSSGLHSVWELNGTIYYSASADGVSWSNPIVLEPSLAVRPSLAATDDGTLGLVYVRNVVDGNGTGQVHYRSRSPSGAWSTPFKVTSDFKSGTARNPSIAAHGSDVHLTWSTGSQVVYATFPASQTAPVPTASDVNLFTLCYSHSITYPSIAVSDGATPSSAPIVRIAWYSYSTPYAGCGSEGFFGLSVAEKPSTPSPIYWPNVLATSTPAGASQTGSVALSLTANRSTGDFYLATSDIINGSEQTELRYENARDPSDTWRNHLLLPRRAIIDVNSATRAGQSQFRIVISDFTLGSNGYGPTQYRTGTWTSTSAAPTWLDSSLVLMSSNGRAGSALFWENANQAFYSVFEVSQGGTSYALVSASERIGDLDLGVVLGPNVAQGNTCGGSNSYQPTCVSSFAPDQGFYWTAPPQGNSYYVISTFGSTFDTILAITDADTGEVLGCNDDASNTRQSMVQTPFLVPGQRLRIFVDGFSSACGDFKLNIHRIGLNVGSSLGSPIMSSDTCFGDNDWSPTCAYSPSALDSSALWTAPATRAYTFSSAGSNYDTVIEVLDLASGTSLACNDDNGTSLQSSVSINLQQGQTVLVNMDGYNSHCGLYYLNVN
ncbi:hypothetical protein [Myxococcus eversor]|uniref:hypothetical protein n=1 Tax=Myxococcus eversor TaxID=2709661 RepID=UPI0013D44313|nr:hypothetical protein [Myxococcus eversor]